MEAKHLRGEPSTNFQTAACVGLHFSMTCGRGRGAADGCVLQLALMRWDRARRTALRGTVLRGTALRWTVLRWTALRRADAARGDARKACRPPLFVGRPPSLKMTSIPHTATHVFTHSH
jgi:hypothetical protein